MKGLGKKGMAQVGHLFEAGVKGLGQLLLKGVEDYLGIWKRLFSFYKSVAVNGWKVLRSVFGGARAAIKTVISDLWSGIKGLFSNGFSSLKGLVKNQIQNVVGFFKGIPGSLRNLGGQFLSAGKSLVEKIFAGVVSAAKKGLGFAASLLSAVKNAINSALHLPLAVSFDKGPIHIHATVIPALAKGTNYFGGGTALVGEQGPELVNLPRGSQVIPNDRLTSTSSSPTGGGGDTYVVVNASGLVDPQSMAREIERELTKLRRNRGGPLAFAT
jgi:phage-related protein